MGVHKFREKQNIGLLYQCTLGIGWFVDIIRHFITAYKGEQIQGNKSKHLSADNPLPFISSNVMPSNGEVCHYCRTATHIKTKNVVGGYYSDESHNTRISIVKGKSVRVENQQTIPIKGDMQESTHGILSITNKSHVIGILLYNYLIIPMCSYIFNYQIRNRFFFLNKFFYVFP